MRAVGYTNAELVAIENSTMFEHLVPIAMKIITNLGPPMGMVCGPISAAGGTKSVERNMNIFSSHIQFLENRGLKIFNQLPFEKTLWRIIKDKAYYKGGTHLLDAFYLPIFQSGALKTFYFIPNWESSFGANWEHEQALKLGIELIYL